MKRLALLALLLAGCDSASGDLGTVPPPAPTAAVVGWVVNGGGDGIELGWMDVATCSQRPRSWREVVAYCDLDNLQRVFLDPPSVLLAYHFGDPYPHPADWPR